MLTHSETSDGVGPKWQKHQVVCHWRCWHTQTSGGVGLQWRMRQALPLCLRALSRGDFNSGHKVEQGTKENLSVSLLNSRRILFQPAYGQDLYNKIPVRQALLWACCSTIPSKETAVDHMRLTLMGAWIGEGAGLDVLHWKSWMGSLQCVWGGRQRWAWTLPTPPELQSSWLVYGWAHVLVPLEQSRNQS